MKEKKLQVFVSSTFTDLIEERQAAVEAILSSGNIPAGMELFSAGDESQMTIIKRWIDESDVYMLILGGRYGSLEPVTGKSYTHLEYDYAIKENKPFFAVILSDTFIDEKVKIAGKSVLEPENTKELINFKSLVSSKMVKFCDDKKDIKLAIHETLSDFNYRKDLVGWIRGDNSVNSSLLAEQIANLTRENGELRNNLINSTYNGLKYIELEEILSDEKVEWKDEVINLNQFLLKNGPRLSIGINISMAQNSPFQRLKYYKIVKSTFSHPHFLYLFTSEGHNFYLKLLYNTYKKDKGTI